MAEEEERADERWRVVELESGWELCRREAREVRIEMLA